MTAPSKKTRATLIAENGRMIEALRLIYLEADRAIQRAPSVRADIESFGYVEQAARAELELHGYRMPARGVRS